MLSCRAPILFIPNRSLVTENGDSVTEKLAENSDRLVEKLVEKAIENGDKLTKNRIAILRLIAGNP